MYKGLLFLVFYIFFQSYGFSQKKETKTAYFASGCFWCTEALFELIVGVKSVESGYTGGTTKNPTYEQVCSGKTGHAEAVKVVYYPHLVTYEKLIRAFFDSHDPSTKNQQGPDRGTQYRSAIFYQNDAEKEAAWTYIKQLKSKGIYSNISTEVVLFSKFYPAEYYHQDFEKLNPDNPYVRSVGLPRIKAFKKKTKIPLHE